MKKNLTGFTIGIAGCMFAANAMAAGFDKVFPANSGPLGEPAVMLFNGALMLGLGFVLRNKLSLSEKD